MHLIIVRQRTRDVLKVSGKVREFCPLGKKRNQRGLRFRHRGRGSRVAIAGVAAFYQSMYRAARGTRIIVSTSSRNFEMVMGFAIKPSHPLARISFSSSR